MALDKKFPKSPHEIIHPDLRWYPDGDLDNRRIVPVLVKELRERVYHWREAKYEGASDTSIALLNWWFGGANKDESADRMRYYFAQQEAMETIVYLYEVEKVLKSRDFLEFDSIGSSNYSIKPKQISEKWPRYVVKLATGTGKTKVLSMAIVWSYFHKLYEKDSQLARNFLLLCPNIIVMDRLKTDFGNGSPIFHKDPLLPKDGFYQHSWEDDFDMAVHVQDDAKVDPSKGNLFLTNIHRVYSGNEKSYTVNDGDTSEYFLGPKSVDAKKDEMDVGEIVRNVDELMVLNDEAHHIRDNKWAEVINDLNNNLIHKGKKLSMQLDVSATPKDAEGNIFPHTICDYPLVEAIYQEVVKHPVLPDDESRNKCREKDSINYVEQYEDFLKLGLAEWKNTCDIYKKTGKQPLLFVMVRDTKICDAVGEYLSEQVPELLGKVLIIHTNNNGEIGEKVQGKAKKELDVLRQAANDLDSPDSPYKAVVSVLMLKEGWDIKNVSTIVGLRAYSSDDNILAEQTLGRGLRRMSPEHFIDGGETLSIIGTDKFMDFIQTVKKQGVDFIQRPMGASNGSNLYLTQITPSVDKAELDIEVPILGPKYIVNYEKINSIDVSKLIKSKHKIEEFADKELLNFVFEYAFPKDDADKEHHTLQISEGSDIDITNIIKWYVYVICKSTKTNHLQDIVYEMVYEFITKHLFELEVALDDLNIARNLSEVEIKEIIIDNFTTSINKAININDEQGVAEVKDWRKLSDIDVINSYKEPINNKKSILGRMVGESKLEEDISLLLDSCKDIISHSKIYRSWGFSLDYEKADSGIAQYIPDFLVKQDEDTIYVIESKGAEYAVDQDKFSRLKEWCKLANKAQDRYKYESLYITEEKFYTHNNALKKFSDIKKIATKK